MDRYQICGKPVDQMVVMAFHLGSVFLENGEQNENIEDERRDKLR